MHRSKPIDSLTDLLSLVLLLLVLLTELSKGVILGLDAVIPQRTEFSEGSIRQLNVSNANTFPFLVVERRILPVSWDQPECTPSSSGIDEVQYFLEEGTSAETRVSHLHPNFQ